ncbi:MAG: DNA mismatch repair protein MutS, partial [Clostridia bacterium]|nr:DNA mismatch repair protein MutS [Clostridia bacterium]
MKFSEIDKEQLSPMMRRYYDTKVQYSDAILMYRLGDFYEMFFDDAETASRELELTLTGRDCGLENRAPMCGVPYHAVDGYVAKLVSKGYKVAICDQVGAVPTSGKEIMDREVMRVITAGTVIDEGMVRADRGNYLVSIYLSEKIVGFAWADITTGEFNLYEKKSEDVVSVLDNFFAAVGPSEIIANAEACAYNDKVPSLYSGKYPKMQAYYDWAYKYNNAYDSLKAALNVATLDAFDVTDKKAAVSAAGALNEYLHETQKRALPQFSKLSYFNEGKYMLLDSAARRNLELVETSKDRKKQGSLLWVIDKTDTSMGGRMLRKWLDYPSLEEKVLNARLDAVAYYVEHTEERAKIKSILSELRDLERFAGRCAYGNVSPSDMYQIALTLMRCPELKGLLAEVPVQMIKKIASVLPSKTPLADELRKALDSEHCGAEYKRGGFILSDYNKELAECRAAKQHGDEWIRTLELTEKEQTGIKTLHIGYNKVFGYYIEVSKSNVGLVPFRYHRKQTLVNGERYITEELKAIEEKLLTAESRALEIELELFESFKKMLANEVTDMLKIANAIAVLDAVLSLATVAKENDYVRPTIGKSVKRIYVENGRHPVVEKIVGTRNYIPNGVDLDDSSSTMIITGPNMSGKSTYMRQIALITLLAHIGSFVPATKAEIALTDRIFTRIGASDDLSSGQSTFMVEMSEVANILNNATKDSLLILDEIGRGTSTYDGLSIAWAVLEFIADQETCGAKALFATHYHELSELEGRLSGVKNYRISVKEIGENILFLRKIVRGSADKSFGVQVARLAGIPDAVIARAGEILRGLENSDMAVQPAARGADTVDNSSKTVDNCQNTVDNPVDNAVLADLKALNL